MLATILLVFAFVLFVMGFYNPPAEPYRSAIRLTCLGLAFLAAAEILTRVPKIP